MAPVTAAHFTLENHHVQTGGRWKIDLWKCTTNKALENWKWKSLPQINLRVAATVKKIQNSDVHASSLSSNRVCNFALIVSNLWARANGCIISSQTLNKLCIDLFLWSAHRRSIVWKLHYIYITPNPAWTLHIPKTLTAFKRRNTESISNLDKVMRLGQLIHGEKL